MTAIETRVATTREPLPGAQAPEPEDASSLAAPAAKCEPAPPEEAAQVPAALEYEVFEDRYCPGQWHVGAVDLAGDGRVYAAVFTGSLAKERAERYAAWARGGAAAS